MKLKNGCLPVNYGQMIKTTMHEPSVVTVRCSMYAAKTLVVSVKSSCQERLIKVLNDDVRALFNHDPNFVLGRTASGTLTLRADDTGLGYDIKAPDNQTIRDLVIAPMQRGDINQSSFAFRVGDDEWDEDDEGVIVRTIHSIKRLIDISPVTYAAYTDATAATRSLQQWQEARSQGDLRKAINQRQARERMLDLLGA